MSVRAADTTIKLMKVIKNPIGDHLPVGYQTIFDERNLSNAFTICRLVAKNTLCHTLERL